MNVSFFSMSACFKRVDFGCGTQLTEGYNVHSVGSSVSYHSIDLQMDWAQQTIYNVTTVMIWLTCSALLLINAPFLIGALPFEYHFVNKRPLFDKYLPLEDATPKDYLIEESDIEDIEVQQQIIFWLCELLLPLFWLCKLYNLLWAT